MCSSLAVVSRSSVVRPPGPKGPPILGMLPKIQREGPTLFQRLARKYGDVVFMRVPGQNVYVLTHPDMTREVLVTQQHRFKKSRILERATILLGSGLLTNEGMSHRRQRRLVQPAFHRDRLAGYARIMADRACAARDQWHDGETLDMFRQMLPLTLDIISRTMFSSQVEGDAKEIERTLEHVFGLFDLLVMPFSEYLQKLPLPSVLRFRAARKRLDSMIYRLIAQRRASGEDKGDLLSMLLMAQDDEGGGGMTDVQVRDELLTLFLAGHETTAVALTWIWYLLSQNPKVQAKMHEEIDSVLGIRAPSLDDLPNLPYTNAVFAEGLRLYPPAWAIARRALEDVQLGEYLVPKGNIVLLCTFVTHRDPRWYSEPEEFWPDRWLEENLERPKFAYFPFGGGARVCIGERFAGMEGPLLLAAIAQKWRFTHEPGHVVEPRAQLTLRPRYGMRMTAMAR